MNRRESHGVVVGEQEANKGPEEVTERENSMKKKKNSTTTGQEEVEKKKGKNTEKEPCGGRGERI